MQCVEYEKHHFCGVWRKCIKLRSNLVGTYKCLHIWHVTCVTDMFLCFTKSKICECAVTFINTNRYTWKIKIVLFHVRYYCICIDEHSKKPFEGEERNIWKFQLLWYIRLTVFGSKVQMIIVFFFWKIVKSILKKSIKTVYKI